jgi:hypothetical protein
MMANFRILCLSLAMAVSLSANEAPSTDSGGQRTTRNRAMSSGVSSALSAGFAYNPPKPEPEPEEPKPEDVPRNGIVRLPNYVVLGQKPPVFADRNLRTKSELAKMAKGKYLSEFDRGVLNRVGGPSWSNFSNEKRAMQAYYDDEREKAIEEADRNVYLYRESGDEAKATLAEEEAKATAYRPSTATTRSSGTWFGESK